MTLSNIEISQHSEDFADVLFTQNYKSDSYSDEVTKQLRMQKIDDKWLIIKEKTIKIRQKTELQLVKKNEVLEDTTTVQIEHDVKEALNSWSKVWSSQDIDGYFAAYAEDFLPSNISNKKKWKKQRHNRVISPSYIKVTLTDVKITQHSKNNVDVVFNQNYESSNHSDDVRKLISMRRENERWLITKERVKKVLIDISEDLSSQDKTNLIAELDSHSDSSKNYADVVPGEDDLKDESILRRRDVPADTVLEKRSGSPKHKSHQAPPEMDPHVRPSEFEPDLFGSDPVYPDNVYDVAEQIKIYGGKTPFDEPRPILEFGYPLYSEGALGRTYDVIGEKNLLRPQLLVYGDFRSALAFNDNGNKEIGQIAARLNLDVDLKLTATERIHLFLRPIDKNNNFLRHEFFGDDHNDFDFVLDANLETIYFEGDIGAIQSGLTNEWATYDLPFAIGFMPLLFQNGIWLDDAFVGAAFAIPAMNSPKYDISNICLLYTSPSPRD